MIDLPPIPPRPTAVDLCADALRGAILDGRLPPGERLPPERLLAEQFGVNRVTLRGALSRLAASGLVEVRQGSGTRVLDYRERGGPDLLPGLGRLAEDPEDFLLVAADLLLVRRHLAQAVLQRLFERCEDTPYDEDLIAWTAPIVEAVELFAETADRAPDDTDALAEADLGVVRAILDATESPVLAVCFNPIARALREMPRLRAALYAEPERNLAGWRFLLEQLPAADPALLGAFDYEIESRDRVTLDRLSAPDPAP